VDVSHVCSSITADDFHQYFNDKVDGVRVSTLPACSTAVSPSCMMSEFMPLSVDDVIDAIRQLPIKQCEADPMTTRLLKVHVDVLAPFLTALLNASLSQGLVPASFKAAYITPI
jgi:hypothetical protein